MQTERIREIIGRFDTAGTVADLRAVGNGWINDTYRVMTVSDETPDYILQRINHHVFKDVELLQRNIERVTSHIRRKLAAAGADDLDRRVLRIVPARDGRLYHFDGENYWRMTLFIAGSVTHETISAPLALLTGRAFGEFQAMLSDMEEGVLGETIPDFHNIEFRIGGLRDAVAAVLQMLAGHRDGRRAEHVLGEHGVSGKCAGWRTSCSAAATRCVSPNGSTAKAGYRSASRTATRRSTTCFSMSGTVRSA